MHDDVKIVVTRHKALVEYIRELGLIDDQVKVISHATADDVRDKDVIGILPLSLAAEANSVTEVPLSLTPDMRGKELSLEEVREIAGNPCTYVVKKEEVSQWEF